MSNRRFQNSGFAKKKGGSLTHDNLFDGFDIVTVYTNQRPPKGDNLFQKVAAKLFG